MKSARSHREAVFGSLQRKSFRAALAAQLSKHIPTLGTLTADALASHLETLFHKFFPPPERLGMGQLVWPAVAKNATAGYGKPIEQTPLQPVLLSLVTSQDLTDYLQGMSKSQLRRKMAIRLFEQAYEQDGVLTRADVAFLLGLDPSTVSKYVREFERETQRTVPRRGTVHDIGPSITHKRQICYQVLVLGRSIEQTARDTHHSPEAVTRYVKDYQRIRHCLQHGFSIDQTAFATRLSRRLVEEYAGLHAEHQRHQPPSEPALVP